MAEVSDLVVVYSKPGCGQCVGVKMFLKQNKISHIVKDISDPEIREEFDSYGLNALPVVVKPNGEVFTGFNHGELSKIKSEAGL